MSAFSATRGGLPRLRAKLDRGEGITIAAFGTSMTVAGRYLQSLGATLGEAYANAAVDVKNVGRNGFDSVLAAFDTQSVIAERPDAICLEFSINDDESSIHTLIVPALLGILGQVRDALPECEFVFVYFARTDRPGRSIPIHDAVADYFAFPSIDLARLSAQLVRSGEATYGGETTRALTSDGIHHTEAAAQLIGVPFADAFRTILAANDRAPEPVAIPPLSELADRIVARNGDLASIVARDLRFDGDVFCAVLAEKLSLGRTENERLFAPACLRVRDRVSDVQPEDIFRRARRAAPQNFIVRGQWGLGARPVRPVNLHFGADVLTNSEAGGILRLPLASSFVALMGFATGTSTLTIRIDGWIGTVSPGCVVDEHDPELALVWPLLVTSGLGPEAHVIDVLCDGPFMGFTDIFYFEPPAA